MSSILWWSIPATLGAFGGGLFCAWRADKATRRGDSLANGDWMTFAVMLMFAGGYPFVATLLGISGG